MVEIREIRTDAGSILRSESDGSVRGETVREFVVRQDGVLIIDGGQVEVRVRPNGSGWEIVPTGIGLAQLSADRGGDRTVSPNTGAKSKTSSGTGKQPAGQNMYYSSAEVAERFFGKSTQWLYWGLRKADQKGNPIQPIFVYEDGTPIEAEKVGKGNRARYTLPVIREMAYSCYRRGNLKESELRDVLAKIAEAGGDPLN